MAERAKQAKEKGNAAFKAGDYADAVGHYSAAIVADRTDPTLPLNRAATYLKLGKNEDAERDCSTVLDLPLGKNNVKALFRRAQARIALVKNDLALKDLEEALRLEPDNAAVKAELQRVPMAPKKSMLAKAAPAAKPYRRRVPIKIVESNAAAASSAPAAPAQSNIAAKSPDALLNPVSSRTLSSAPSSSKTPAPPTPQKPLAEASVPTSGVGKNNFTVTPRDPWEVREVNGHRIGGGIIRRAAVSSNPMGETNPGNIKNERSSGSASPSSKPATPSGPDNSASASTFDVERMAATAPTPTLFDFTRSWNNSKDLEGKWKTLQTIPPSALPTLFRTSLEPPLLVSIMKAFSSILSHCSPAARNHIQDYLHTFPKVPRFNIVLMFLSSGEQQLVKGVWVLLGSSAKAEGWNL